MKVCCQSNCQVYSIDEDRGLISEGGEGFVYTIRAKQNHVAKIYKEPQKKSQEKLIAMIRNPPIDNITPGHTLFAWPQDILHSTSKSGRFIGFIMNRIKSAAGFNRVSNPSFREKEHPNFTFRDLLIVGTNVVKAFAALHEKGYIVGDVNEGNLLISSAGLASFVDTDSFQVPNIDTGKTFCCPVFRPEFLAPELHGRDLKKVERKIKHDLFGLGVLLFQLLMEGHHPFHGIPPKSAGDRWSTLEKRILGANFPFGNIQQPLRIPPNIPRLNALHPDLRKLFIACFEDGKSKPNLRPDTKKWKRGLDRAIKNLSLCSANKQHFFDNHLKSCPWCKRERDMKAMLKQTPIPKRSSTVPSVPTWQPPPPPPPPEIQPGIWNWAPDPNDPNTQLALAYANMLGTAIEQEYNLQSNGNLTGVTLFETMGMRFEMNIAGRWAYDTNNKVLTMQGYMSLGGSNILGGFVGDLMNMFGGMQIPPQAFNISFKVRSKAGQGRYYVTDLSQGGSGILIRH